MAKVVPIVDHFFFEASRMKFEREAFFALRPVPFPLPKAEMLARKPNGQSAGLFFDAARAAGRVIDTDIIIFERAVDDQQLTGDFVSINLNVETIFSRELYDSLMRIVRKYPNFDPSKICLEITEQGGVPHNFNPQTLINLKSMGFKLALDDFDPTKPEEHARLRVFGPYVDIVKFPHEMMGDVRGNNDQSCEKIDQSIQHITTHYPPTITVMEGVREEDRKGDEEDEEYPTLRRFGFHVAQRSRFKSSSPVRNLAPT
jgi:EAL domain-containing protein (putative c-di-GMP-specific phosphodiesterase class I)